jgi:hypothetical protein
LGHQGEGVTAKQQLLLTLSLGFQLKNFNSNDDSAARALPGDAMRLHCRGDKPGVRPGGRVTFFAPPKKVTKKRRPDDRAPLRGVPVPSMPGAGRG